MARGYWTVVWLIAAVAGLAPAQDAVAQAKKAPAKAQNAGGAPGEETPAAKKDPAAAQKAFEAGAKAFESGKSDAAIASLTAAIASGALQSQQMAKALYLRGVAFRRQGKPAQAISDLTSALWLKGGLNEAERAVAMENRAGAYREAGLVEPTQVETARNSALAGRPAAVAEKAPAAAPGRTPAGTASGSTVASSWQSSTAVRQAPATTAAVAAPVQPAGAAPQSAAVVPPQPAGAAAQRRAPFPDGSGHTERSITPYTAAVREQVATAPSASEQVIPAQAQPSRSGGGLLKGLLGDLSLGGSAPKRPEVAAPPTQTANVANASWSDATRVVAPAARQQAAAAVAPAAAPPQPEGNYRLQVAAVRTRQEAESVSARLRQQHAKELRSRNVEIDEAALANIGTFYRVRVGPYAEPNEPRNLCVKLRQKGYDCLVVSIAQ